MIRDICQPFQKPCCTARTQAASEQGKAENILFHSPVLIRRQERSRKGIAKPGPEGSTEHYTQAPCGWGNAGSGTCSCLRPCHPPLPSLALEITTDVAGRDVDLDLHSYSEIINSLLGRRILRGGCPCCREAVGKASPDKEPLFLNQG